MNAGLPTKRSFDISQEKDLIALLREVRHSALAPEEKDEVRDAVFALSTTKNSILLRGVKETLATVGIDVVLAEGETVKTPEQSSDEKIPTSVALKKERPRPAHAIGQIRKQPTFSLSNKAAVKQASVTTSSPAADEEVVSPNIELAPKTPSPISEAPSVASSAKESVSTTQTHMSAPSESRMTSEAALARIKEIKQRVNSAVGNPVTLISKNESVGKEYMATLLEAMRAASADGDVNTIMKKLEVIYKKVEEVINTKEDAPPQPTAPASETTPNKIKINRVPETPAAPLKEEAHDLPTETLIPPEAVVAEPAMKTEAHFDIPPEIPEESESEKMPPPLTAQTPEAGTSAADDVDVEQVLKDADAALETAIHEDGTSQASAPDTTPATSLGEDPVPTPAVKNVSVTKDTQDQEVPRWGMTSVSSSKGNAVPFKKIVHDEKATEATDRFQSVTAAPSAIEKQRQVLDQYKQQQREHDINDPLHSAEVQQGLSMLLLEWELFRKSGLLGTGPKGLEHPLYKKMAPLKMNLVISGRFEGATPEVRQSIIDYMNGWRYEHGIVHEMDETFENYLRRVIQTILNKQKQHA